MQEFASRQYPLLSYRGAREARIAHLTNPGGDQPPALILRPLSTAAKLVNVPTPDKPLDVAVYVGCDLSPLCCRKQGHLIHGLQETNGGSAHKIRTLRHSLRTTLDHVGLE